MIVADFRNKKRKLLAHIFGRTHMSAPKVNKLAANFTFGIPSFDISKILFTFVVNHPD